MKEKAASSPSRKGIPLLNISADTPSELLGWIALLQCRQDPAEGKLEKYLPALEPVLFAALGDRDKRIRFQKSFKLLPVYRQRRYVQQMMRNGLGDIGVNPLLGVGPYQWRMLNLQDSDTYFNTWHIHNILIHVAVEMGLVAAAFLLAVAGRSLKIKEPFDKIIYMNHSESAEQPSQRTAG